LNWSHVVPSFTGVGGTPVAALAVSPEARAFCGRLRRPRFR